MLFVVEFDDLFHVFLVQGFEACLFLDLGMRTLNTPVVSKNRSVCNFL